MSDSDYIGEGEIDYAKVMARGGANCGDEDFAVFACPFCRHVYLLEYEVDERLLASYAGADEGAVDRVRLAILKLSEGVAEKMNLAAAVEDPEDTIAWAERPEWMASVIQNRKLSEEEQSRIDTRDWTQYHEWLAKGLK